MIGAEVSEGELVLAFGSMVAALLVVLLPILLKTLKHSQRTYDQVNRVDEIVDGEQAPNLRQLIDSGFQRNDEAHKILSREIGRVQGHLDAHEADPDAHDPRGGSK